MGHPVSMGDILSNGQGQCQVKSGHQMEMLHECPATHVLWVIWDAGSGQTHSKFDRSKVQFQVKLDQISNKKIILQKYAYHIQFCLRIPNMRLIFTYEN